MSSAEAQPNTPLMLAGRTIQPGERLVFDLPAAKLYTRAHLDVRVDVVHGRYAGPKLMVCAAVHGDELNGTESIRRLGTLVPLDSLHGTLIMVPVVNLFGFVHRSRYLPDRRDLNRSFPGNQQGSMASRLAHLIFSQLVTSATHIVDLHTAAVHRENLPQIRAALDQPEVAAMAKAFGTPVVINSALIDKTLRKEAGELDIPVITYEAGEALRLDEQAVVGGVQGIVGVMHALGMLEAPAHTTSLEPYIADSSGWIRAGTDGMFRSLVGLGAAVAKDQTLGVIVSPYGGDELLVTAKSAGIVICRNNLPLVNAGEALFHIAGFSHPQRVAESIAVHRAVVSADDLYDVESVAEVPAG